MGCAGWEMAMRCQQRTQMQTTEVSTPVAFGVANDQMKQREWKMKYHKLVWHGLQCGQQQLAVPKLGDAVCNLTNTHT